MSKIFVLGVFGLFLMGCTIPFTDIEIPFTGGTQEKPCTLVPCVASQEIENDLKNLELLPESLVGDNTALLQAPDKCELYPDSNRFVNCFTEVEHKLYTFKPSYAGVIPTSLVVDVNAVFKLQCFPSEIGAGKFVVGGQVVGSVEVGKNVLETACIEKAPVDWCCRYSGKVEVPQDTNST